VGKALWYSGIARWVEYYGNDGTSEWVEHYGIVG